MHPDAEDRVENLCGAAPAGIRQSECVRFIVPCVTVVCRRENGDPPRARSDCANAPHRILYGLGGTVGVCNCALASRRGRSRLLLSVGYLVTVLAEITLRLRSVL